MNLADPEMHYGCRGDLHAAEGATSTPSSMSGRRHRPSAFLAQSNNCGDMPCTTIVRFRMTPTFGSTLDGTSGCGMKRVPGAGGPWQFIEIFLSSDDKREVAPRSDWSGSYWR
jgi:hypothetical protein